MRLRVCSGGRWVQHWGGGWGQSNKHLLGADYALRARLEANCQRRGRHSLALKEFRI